MFLSADEAGISTMGWFYGFNLHLIINNKVETLNFLISQGNTDDREPLKRKGFLKKFFRKLYEDKRCILKQLFEIPFIDDVHLVKGVRNNLKNSLISINDKIMLRKRSVIEIVNDNLKYMPNLTLQTSFIYQFHS